MYDEIKAKLDEEIMDQLSVLSDMDGLKYSSCR